MTSGITSAIDSKYRVSFAIDVLDALSWKDEILKAESDTIHYMGPGSDGFLVVVSGKTYAEWTQQLRLAETRVGTVVRGKLARLARGHAGLIPFNASIEVKRFRFTLPRDLRVLGFSVDSGDELAALIRGDLFEIYPKRNLADTQGPYWRLIGDAISELRSMKSEDDWHKLGNGGER